MKITSIKRLVESANLESLRLAEEDLMEGKELQIQVEGGDEGEQLTHILAAIWIHETMEKEGLSAKDATRAYTARVRESIS